MAWLAAALGACTLIAELDDLQFQASVVTGAGGAGGMDGGAGPGPGGTGGDGGNIVPIAGHVLAEAGTVFAPSGHSQQSRLFFENGTWRLFYLHSSDSDRVRTRTSTDFVSWTDGDAFDIAHPHGGDGRDLAVATKVIADTRVYHVVTSHTLGNTDRRVAHVRGVVAMMGDLQMGVPADVSTSIWDFAELEPDAPAVALAADDTVFLTSNRDADTVGCGNPYMWRSTQADDGTMAQSTSWLPSEQLSYVSWAVNAHALLPLSDGRVLAVYENGADEPDATNLDASVFDGGTWSMPTTSFSANVPFAQNDWGVVRTAADDVHVVRRLASGDFQHAVFDGQDWQAGSAIAPLAALEGNGIALASDGMRVLVAVIGEEHGHIYASVWDGSAWGAWEARITAPAERRYIASAGAAVEGAAAVYWTELSEAGAVITGAQLTLE